MLEGALFDLALIIVLGIAAQWIGWRLSIPSIVLLLLAGIVAGPVLGWINPDELFGHLLLPLVSICVALILYEGGLSLRIAELPRIGGIVRNLCSVGAVVTWVAGAVAARFILRFPWPLAILLGAILVVTGPTVIGPLLRHIRPTGLAGVALKWEGIVIDPIGALLALLVFEVIFEGRLDHPATFLAIAVGKTTLIGGGLGVAAGYLFAAFLGRSWVPDFLENAVSVMFAVGVFALSHYVQHESGLFAVTVMGIVLANQKWAPIEHIVEFKENLRVLLISTLFVLLAARLEWSTLRGVLLPGLAFVVVLVVIVRPLSVLVSSIGTGMSRTDRLFVASLAPRGIVAAAVASVFALRLEQHGVAGAELLVPVTFTVIIGTVVIYGLCAPIMARWLGVTDANPQGVLFVGAAPWIRSVAATLQERGFRVLLVDTNRQQITEARMRQLPVYNGSALAEATLDEIDLAGLGKLVAATPNDWVNVLAVQRFGSLFGRQNCFQLPPADTKNAKRVRHDHLHGRYIFGPNYSHAVLNWRVLSGATAKATNLSDEFGYDDFLSRYGNSAVPMFVINADGDLEALTDESDPPKPGETIFALVDEPTE